MVGCSDKDVVVDNTKNDYGLVEGESSWIAVGISMPGDPITRGITRSNEDLVDGLTTEFEVKSGTLYLFKGANEDAAKFFKSYPINAQFSNEATDSVPKNNSLGSNPNEFGEITTTSQKFVQEISNPSLGVNDKLYAYVILNNGTATENYTEISATENSTTGAQFKQQQLKAIGIADETKGFGAMGEHGLVMTNVPISTAVGGDQNPATADILTFTEIDKSAIYKTKAEAEADGAQMACIYVERAAVKVEVNLASTGFGIQLDGEDFKSISADDVKWALGNVNFGGTNGTITGVGYYNTRQFDKTWLPYNNLEAISYLKYRMVGRTPFFNKANQSKHTPNLAYRTYFGKDPNYDGAQPDPYNGIDGYIADEGLLNYQLSDAQYTLAPSTYTYTYENTFDELSQIWRNTTYVGVKVKIADAAFYTMEGQPNTKLADNTDVAAVVSTRLHDAINTRKTAIQTAIETDLGKDKKSVNANSTRTISDDVTSVTFDMSVAVAFDADGNGKGYIATTGEQTYTVTLSLTNIKTNGTAASDADAAAITTLAGTNIGTIDAPDNSKVYKYVGGIAYYSTRIQHFGDTETPWGAPGEAYNIYMNNTPCIYPADAKQTFGTPATLHTYGSDRANAWLGRWGIVRNNWYVLTLKKIEGIGSPVPEDYHGEIGNTPDDNPPTSYFISAEVHILPWAKRFQEVTF